MKESARNSWSDEAKSEKKLIEKKLKEIKEEIKVRATLFCEEKHFDMSPAVLLVSRGLYKQTKADDLCFICHSKHLTYLIVKG